MNHKFISFPTLLLFCAVALPACSQDADKDAPKTQQAENAGAKDSDDNGETDKAEPTAPEIKPLTIGSVAPPLDIEHWVQNGDGEFGEVTDFEKGKVYVVEFWATWCGPCIASMPHIVELQDRYADRDVQVISISDEDLETVEKFLDREVRGSEDGSTYRDLTSAYCLTTDPDGSSSRDYMRAANRNGIPCAFIVGKIGLIEWIGHPMAMDEVLEKVVSDQWDRQAFAEEYIAQQEAQEILSQLSRLMRGREIDKGIELLDDYIANGKLESERKRFKQIKFQVLASDKDHADQAANYAVELMADEEHDATSANNLAWNIYLMANLGRYSDERVTKAALKLASSKAEGDSEIRPLLLDTMAHLQDVLGETDAALKTQRRAVKEAAPDQKSRLTAYLQELEERQAAKKAEAKKAEAKKAEAKKAEAKKAEAKKAEPKKAEDKAEDAKDKKDSGDQVDEPDNNE